MVTLNIIQEIQFLLYLTAVLLGYQLSLYFFYRYFKIKDDRLPLNKILLSFGFFYLFIISGAFILAINTFFISEQILKEILFKFGYILMLFSPISFLSFIFLEENSRIIPLKVVRAMIIISFIPILIVAIFPLEAQILIILFSIITILSLGFTLFFQVKLIDISRGIIRSRLIQLFIGDILMISSLFFILDFITSFFPVGIINFLFFIGITLLILGLIIASFGVYGFPELYEFRWRENLLKLFIVNQKNNTCLYSWDFGKIKDEDSKKDYKELFSGGIIGIDSILSAITSTKGEKVFKIKQEDSLILLEYGSDITPQIIFALVVNKDLKSNQYFLISIKNQFELFFKEILVELDNLKGNIEQLFESFDIIIKNIMVI